LSTSSCWGLASQEAELAIKTAAVGGHQVHPLYTSYAWGVEELFHHAAAKTMAL
jgi:hypothetical protein